MEASEVAEVARCSNAVGLDSRADLFTELHVSIREWWKEPASSDDRARLRLAVGSR